MTKAIEQIIDAYVRLGNRRALEDLRTHWRRLAVDLIRQLRAKCDGILKIGRTLGIGTSVV